MRKYFVLLLLGAMACLSRTGAQTNTFPSTGSAGIGTTTPNASALLDIQSTTKGLLIPRMTQGQRNAIPAPATGLVIYQTNNTPGFYVFNGATWTAVTPLAGANRSLSNLSINTAVSQHLLPQADSSKDLGNPALKWRDIYASGVMQNSQLKGRGFRPLFADSAGNIISKVPLPVSSGTDTSTQAIPDNSCSGLTSTITIAGAVPSISGSSVNLKLNIGHPQVNDLSIFLTSPDGKTVCIVNSNDNQISGANFSNTVIREVEAGSLSSGTAPYSGAFTTSGNMTSFVCGPITPNISSFFGLGTFNPNGTWTLRIFDTKPGNSGTLVNWTVDIGIQEASQGVWSLTGNESTNRLNFIGTLDNQPLRFRVNNTPAAIISAIGNVGIGTSSPTARMHLLGSGAVSNSFAEPILQVDNIVNSSFISVRSPAGKESALVFGQNTADSLSSSLVSNASVLSGGLQLRTTGQNRISIDNLGRVGVNAIPTSTDAVFNVKGFTGTTGNTMSVKNFNGRSLFAIRDDGRMAFDTTVISNITYNLKSLGASSATAALKLSNASNVGLLQVNDDGQILISNGGIKLQVGGTTGDGLRIGSFETMVDSGVNFITINSKFAPDRDNTPARTLGDATHRWPAVFAANGTINTSDARDKENIQPIRYGLETIMKLRPVSFNWKNNYDRSIKLGLIAQDLQKVIPEVVVDKEWVSKEEGGAPIQQPAARLGVYYSDIIPVLIKGIQEQQEENNQLKQKVTDLETRLARLEQALMSSESKYPSSAKVSAPKAEGVRLEQNAPNPFNRTTSIGYTLPSRYGKAALIVQNKEGKTLFTKTLTGTGSGKVVIEAALLAAGAYSYSLLIDEKVADTKQMILAR